MNIRIETTETNATTEPLARSRPSRLALAVVVWLSLAAGLATTGLLHAHPQLIGASAALVVTVWSLAYASGGRIREALDAVPLRALVVLHLVRIAFGALFVVEAARGHMNAIFALRAGPGDIVVGVLALGLLVAPRHAFERLALAWNVVGFFDIGVAFFTAQWLVIVRHDASMLSAIARLPYSLLPTFVVPMVALTHVLMVIRLRRRVRS